MLGSKECNVLFNADFCSDLFPCSCSVKHYKNMMKVHLKFCWKTFNSLKCCVCVARCAAVRTI